MLNEYDNEKLFLLNIRFLQRESDRTGFIRKRESPCIGP